MRQLATAMIFVLLGGVCYGKGKDLQAIYEARAKSLKRRVLHLGAVEVILSETDRTSPGIPQSIGTDSKIETRKGGKKVDTLEFKGLDAVGGYTGLLLPPLQPLKDYLVLKKLGNYDTRLILVDSNGLIHNLPAGVTYLSPQEDTQHRLLFAIRTTPKETGEFALLDLQAKKLLIHQSDDVKAVEFDKASKIFKEGVIYQFFIQSGKYFAVATEKDPAKPELARELSQASFVRLNDNLTEFLVEKRDVSFSVGAISLKELLPRDQGWVTLR